MQEYEVTREVIVEELRPVRRRVANRSPAASEVRAEKQRLEQDLWEVRQRFRRERQELDREIAEAKEELDRVCEADLRVSEILEELESNS